MVMKAFVRHARWFALAALVMGLGDGVSAQESTQSWSSSVIKIESTRHQYEYFQPWSRRTASNNKFGVVVHDQRIITTADYLFDQTIIRVQKGGRGSWYEAKLQWIDYHANLALLEVEDAGFWDGLQPVRFADPIPTTGEARLMRWNDGRLESRRLEINRLRLGRSALSYIDLPQLELDSEVEGVGWSEAVVVGNQLIGLTTSQARSKCSAIPSFLVQQILKEVDQGTFRGVGFFNFYWKKAENPAALDYLELPGQKRGVIVTEIIEVPGHETVLHPKDILLKVDGFEIDIVGDYEDPSYGKLMLERLATREHWAGDPVPMTVWREGAMIDLMFHLPKADYRSEYVPSANYDMPPEYLMAGGLVFQPLTEPYLRSWGGEWQRRAPVRLVRLKSQAPTEEDPSCVVLSAVLPDPYNLDAPLLKDATQRVMFNYRLPTDYVVGEVDLP